MHKYHVKWRVTSVVIRWMFFLSTGTSGGYSQWVGTLDGEVKRGHHILCKSVAAMPCLNRPHKRRSWRRWLWWWAEPAVDKDILSYPAPAKVDGRVVTFVDGRTYEADVIVQATGYSQRFPFLHGRENPTPRHSTIQTSCPRWDRNRAGEKPGATSNVYAFDAHPGTITTGSGGGASSSVPARHSKSESSHAPSIADATDVVRSVPRRLDPSATDDGRGRYRDNATDHPLSGIGKKCISSAPSISAALSCGTGDYVVIEDHYQGVFVETARVATA